MSRARVAVVLCVVAIGACACAALIVFVWTRRAVQVDVAGRAGVAPPAALASLARGAYLYQRGARCAACHAADLGGAFVIRDPLVATLWGPNLTRGVRAVGVRYRDADFERAIRRGLRPSGQRLLAMPSWDYARMSDADVASLIAYIRAAKPVVRDPPSFTLGVLGRLQLVSGILAFDSDHIADVPSEGALPPGLAVARVAGCLRCHAADGMPAPPPLPPERRGAALRDLPRLGFAALAVAVRDGRAPNGTAIAEHAAPALPGSLDAPDVAALCAYLDRTFGSAGPRASRTAHGECTP
ncbi:MAG TPA: cytochrome c [Candidatus Elarobacter sp.]|nr:cytochrome c [Candidatus Elarobacter sp.]